MTTPNFSNECQCGAAKEKGALFCDPCFSALPNDVCHEINIRFKDLIKTARKASDYLTLFRLPQ